MAEWQPIETAPKDGSVIMLGSKRGAWLAKYVPVYRSGHKPGNPWFSMMLNHDYLLGQWHPPTHWMHLPAPPEKP